MSASTEKKLRQAAREAGTDKKQLAAEAEARQKAKSKRRWTLGTIGVCLLIAVILLLNSGLIYRTTAYTVGDRSFSAAEMNYHYASQYYYFANQYGSYASIFGLDTSGGIQGLDKQDCPMGEGSWRDYFLSAAETQLGQMTALLEYARDNGVSLDEDELAEIDESFVGLDDYVKLMGYANANKYFTASYGEGVDKKLVREAYVNSALADKAMAALTDSFQYTGEELKEKYDSYNGDRDTYDYDYYYVAAETVETTAEDGTTSSAATDETRAAAKAKADEIAAKYSESEGEDYTARLNGAIAAVVPEASAYEQTSVNGGSLGDYKDWVMNASRAAGDITVIENNTGAGYYIVVFLAHSDNDYALAQVRHILVKAEADAEGKYTDEAKAAAKAKAEEILAEFEAGDKSEESFAALAEQYSEDGGSNTNGGLYDAVAKGQMVEQFDEFCFTGHKPGDTGIVYGESAGYAGYHVMYYVGEGENYRDYIARNDMQTEAVSTWLSEKVAGYGTSTGFGLKFVG